MRSAAITTIAPMTAQPAAVAGRWGPLAVISQDQVRCTFAGATHFNDCTAETRCITRVPAWTKTG